MEFSWGFVTIFLLNIYFNFFCQMSEGEEMDGAR